MVLPGNTHFAMKYAQKIYGGTYFWADLMVLRSGNIFGLFGWICGVS